MDTPKNGWIYEGVVMNDPKELRNETTGALQGHSVELAQFGEKLSFYIGVDVLPNISRGENLIVQGRLKPGKTGWAKATSAEKAKVTEAAVNAA